MSADNDERVEGFSERIKCEKNILPKKLLFSRV